MTSNVILTADVENEAWRIIIIDGKSYLIYVTKRCNNVTKIVLTDLVNIWVESLTKKQILDKCSRLNPMLTIDNDEYENVVQIVLNNIPKYTIAASTDLIQLRMNYEGGIFKLNLELCKGTPEEFSEYITKPLFISSMELFYRQNFLLDLVKKKDVEIAEYKAQGAELLRKHIETKAFDENQFNAHIVKVDNNTECISTFKDMMDLHTRLIKEKSTKTADTDTLEKNNKTVEQMSNKSNAVHVDEISKNATTKTGLDNPHVSSNIASEPIIHETRERNKKKSINSKTMITPIVVPHKKVRKTLNDFIL